MTTLVAEEPYAAVVQNRYLSFTCSKCFAWNFLDGPERLHLSRCAGCRVVFYCSKTCQKRDWEDHKAECKFLRSFPAGSIPGEDTRLVFRMLMKNSAQPNLKAFNGRTYDSLMDHCIAQINSESVMAEVKKTCDEIQSYMGPQTPSFEKIFLAISKKAINGFGISDGTPTADIRGMGIYLGLAIHDHSCSPDAFTISEGSKLLLRTTKKDCVYSDKLTICYPEGDFFRDTLMRRWHLFSCYLFHCKCEECEDVEADKKRTSGRSSCCPKGWFSLADLRCSICDKEVPSELGRTAMDANKTLREIMQMAALEWGLADEWIKLFETHKKVLSDENTYLIGLADMICNSLLSTDLETSLKYADICLAQMRQRPYGLTRSSFLGRRYLLHEMIGKSLVDTKRALDEAFETIEIAYGKDHELTQHLREKKMQYDLAAKLNF